MRIRDWSSDVCSSDLGRVQALAVVAVGQHGDGAVPLGARDSPGAVLAGDEAPLAVAGVAVRIVGRPAELGDAAARRPLQHAIVGNVAPQQEAAVAEVNRPLGPERAAVELLELAVAVEVAAEAPVARIVLRKHAPAPSYSDGPYSPLFGKQLSAVMRRRQSTA